jgi:formylglycine-generating enzyme required for sulfatase activity
MGKGPFGTLDHAGNVWEWCQDIWDEEAYTKRKEKDSVDPVVVDGNTSMRVFRGGGYWDEVANLRCACRFRYRAVGQDPNCGFRVALLSV